MRLTLEPDDAGFFILKANGVDVTERIFGEGGRVLVPDIAG